MVSDKVKYLSKYSRNQDQSSVHGSLVALLIERPFLSSDMAHDFWFYSHFLVEGRPRRSVLLLLGRDSAFIPTQGTAGADHALIRSAISS
jgi:hypothetical protein